MAVSQKSIANRQKPKKGDQIKSLLTLTKYARRHKIAIAISFTLVLLTNVLMLISPILLKGVIDELNPELGSVPPQRVTFYALIIFGVALIGAIFRFGQRRVIGSVAHKIEYELRNDLFSHLQKMSRSYFDRVNTGDLMSRATNDLDAVQRVLGFGIIFAADAIVFFTLALSIMLKIDPILTLFSLLPFPILVIVIQQISKKLHDNFEKIQEGFSTLNTKVQENLSGIRVVRSYTLEDFERSDFDKHNKDFVELNRNFFKLEAFFFPMFRLLPGIGSLILLWIGGVRVINGVLSLGEFVAFNAYLSMLIRPMIMLGFIVNRFAQGAASINRINEIINETPEIYDESPQEISQIHGEVEFKNLIFGYEKDQPILKGIDLKIPRGSTIAIVGATASGKTTLINTISRIYQVDRGMLFIDGVDVRDLPLKILRSSIGVVQQEPFIFSDLLKDNLAYGVDSASEAELKEVSHNVDLLSQIDNFPDGFETSVGERGKTLSGGQKQRTSIGRAVMTDPRILILDDALASVDTHTEDTILTRLRETMKNCTTIIISHRISTVKNADQIIVLEDGTIAERGTHEKLISQNGIYARIHEKQLLQEEIESL